MCVDHKKICVCGQGCASLQFRDEIMPEETVENIYCPACSDGIRFESDTMIRDNGWVIKYDMDIVRLMEQKIPATKLTPDKVFDEGYCTWNGIYPGDQTDSIREREELVKLARTDKRKYLEEFKSWGIRRMQRLGREGWRKANERE